MAERQVHIGPLPRQQLCNAVSVALRPVNYSFFPTRTFYTSTTRYRPGTHDAYRLGRYTPSIAPRSAKASCNRNADKDAGEQ